MEGKAVGDEWVSDQPRSILFVTAKRAGLKIKTKKVDGGLQVTVLGVNDPAAELATAKKVVKKLPASHRLEVFEDYELCCGMVRSHCVCEVEDKAEPGLLHPDPSNSVAAFLAQARAKKGNPAPLGAPVKAVEDEWEFTSKDVQYDDTGDCFRQQRCVNDPKRVRTVQVDADDHSIIIKVK